MAWYGLRDFKGPLEIHQAIPSHQAILTLKPALGR